MYVTIGFCQFCDYFRSADRNENFSYEGKRVLFDYFEQYEEETGEKVELDIISLCCNYQEMTFSEAADNYSIDISDCTDDTDIESTVTDYLNDQTMVCGTVPYGIVFQVF